MATEDDAAVLAGPDELELGDAERHVGDDQRRDLRQQVAAEERVRQPRRFARTVARRALAVAAHRHFGHGFRPATTPTTTTTTSESEAS